MDNPVTIPTENQQQYVRQLAADINYFNQLALFCGLATATSVPMSAQIILGDSRRSTMILNVTALLPALAAEGKRLQESLTERAIDTDALLLDVSTSLAVLTKQKGG